MYLWSALSDGFISKCLFAQQRPNITYTWNKKAVFIIHKINCREEMYLHVNKEMGKHYIIFIDNCSNAYINKLRFIVFVL